jgi:hypothetical protein
MIYFNESVRANLPLNIVLFAFPIIFAYMIIDYREDILGVSAISLPFGFFFLLLAAGQARKVGVSGNIVQIPPKLFSIQPAETYSDRKGFNVKFTKSNIRKCYRVSEIENEKANESLLVYNEKKIPYHIRLIKRRTGIVCIEFNKPLKGNEGDLHKIYVTVDEPSNLIAELSLSRD